MRLDRYLVENDLARSRERAKTVIKEGLVTVNGRACDKAAFEVAEGDIVEVTNSDNADYVGRGIFKLETAFKAFGLDVRGKVCADIGASTGGFTQLLLQKGAKCVYAVDVGHGQLDESLVRDSRVINCEGVNARYLTPDLFETAPQFISADLSFISLSLVMPALTACLADNGEMAVLIKPQFEAGRQALNKNGIVKDKKAHITVLENMLTLFEGCGLTVCALTASAIKGGDGNVEYLAYLCKNINIGKVSIDCKKVVETAFAKQKD